MIAADESNPYVTLHSLECPNLPEHFQLTDYPGLLLSNVISTENGSSLISYWRDQQLFKLGAQRFTRALGGVPPASCTGHLMFAIGQKRNWWKQFPIWTALITASAFLGAIAALWQQGAQLLESPDATVQFSDDNPVDVNYGEVSRLKFSLTNQARFASMAIRLDAGLVPVGGTTNDSRQVDRVSKIDPGTAKTFAFPEIISEGPDSTPEPLPYKLHVDAFASAGLLRRERRFSYDSSRLNIWKTIAATRLTLKRPAAENICSLDGSLYSGRDQSVISEIVVSLPVPIDSLITSVKSASFTNVQISRSGKVAKQVFRVNNLRKFNKYPYTLNIHAQGLNRQMCADLSNEGDSHYANHVKDLGVSVFFGEEAVLK